MPHPAPPSFLIGGTKEIPVGAPPNWQGPARSINFAPGHTSAFFDDAYELQNPDTVLTGRAHQCMYAPGGDIAQRQNGRDSLYGFEITPFASPSSQQLNITRYDILTRNKLQTWVIFPPGGFPKTIFGNAVGVLEIEGSTDVYIVLGGDVTMDGSPSYFPNPYHDFNGAVAWRISLDPDSTPPAFISHRIFQFDTPGNFQHQMLGCIHASCQFQHAAQLPGGSVTLAVGPVDSGGAQTAPPVPLLCRANPTGGGGFNASGYIVFNQQQDWHLGTLVQGFPSPEYDNITFGITQKGLDPFGVFQDAWENDRIAVEFVSSNDFVLSINMNYPDGVGGPRYYTPSGLIDFRFQAAVQVESIHEAKKIFLAGQLPRYNSFGLTAAGSFDGKYYFVNAGPHCKPHPFEFLPDGNPPGSGVAEPCVFGVVTVVNVWDARTNMPGATLPMRLEGDVDFVIGRDTGLRDRIVDGNDGFGGRGSIAFDADRPDLGFPNIWLTYHGLQLGKLVDDANFINHIVNTFSAQLLDGSILLRIEAPRKTNPGPPFLA